MYIMQKVLLNRSKLSGNTINAYEWMYWIALTLLPIQLLSLKYYFKADIFPVPKQVRGTFIARCVLAMTSNVAYLISMNFISFSEATVIFWSNPVFTAIGARYYLGERLTNYDWVACFIAFIGILMVQNPFADQTAGETFENHLIGTTIALIGAFLSSATQLSIR
jgi:drug/metabolite transporter (DMT)-like permease